MLESLNPLFFIIFELCSAEVFLLFEIRARQSLVEILIEDADIIYEEITSRVFVVSDLFFDSVI